MGSGPTSRPAPAIPQPPPLDMIIPQCETNGVDRLASLELFVRIVERRSFTAAAADLGVSRPAATAAIKALEQRLGARLLQRSTRHVVPTVEGEAYHARCVRLLADLEEADRGVSGEIGGLLRVDVPGNLARTLILPALPAFLARHPGLAVQLSEGERFVDLVREGFDCVVRAGLLADSGLVARPLGAVEEMTCASPAYLARCGVPATPDDLAGHEMVGFVSSRTGQPLPLEFTRDGAVIEAALPARVLVGGADLSIAAALQGLGLIQSPRARLAPEIEAGRLVEVLAAFPPTPTPVALVYPSRRLSPRVRLFADWLEALLRPGLHTPQGAAAPAPTA